ncbi:unnamed protein product, partial [Amoebophrya sp. A120]
EPPPPIRCVSHVGWLYVLEPRSACSCTSGEELQMLDAQDDSAQLSDFKVTIWNPRTGASLGSMSAHEIAVRAEGDLWHAFFAEPIGGAVPPDLSYFSGILDTAEDLP